MIRQNYNRLLSTHSWFLFSQPSPAVWRDTSFDENLSFLVAVLQPRWRRRAIHRFLYTFSVFRPSSDWRLAFKMRPRKCYTGHDDTHVPLIEIRLSKIVSQIPQTMLKMKLFANGVQRRGRWETLSQIKAKNWVWKEKAPPPTSLLEDLRRAYMHKGRSLLTKSDFKAHNG